MSETSPEHPELGLSSTQVLSYIGGALALFVAGLHLFHPQHGLGRLVRLLAADPGLLVTHPRPVAFALSAIAIVVGIYLAIYGIARRHLYVLGVGLMVVYLVGYFAWHLSGHGGFLPGREPHYHGLGPLEAVVSHLQSDGWAAAAIVSETILAAILAVLYRRDGN